MLAKGVKHKAIPATISKLHEIILASLLSTPAADIILDNELTGENLNANIEKIVLDKEKCSMMGKNALTVSTEDVENKIYAQIIETIKTKNN